MHSSITAMLRCFSLFLRKEHFPCDGGTEGPVLAREFFVRLHPPVRMNCIGKLVFLQLF